MAIHKTLFYIVSKRNLPFGHLSLQVSPSNGFKYFPSSHLEQGVPATSHFVQYSITFFLQYLFGFSHVPSK